MLIDTIATILAFAVVSWPVLLIIIGAIGVIWGAKVAAKTLLGGIATLAALATVAYLVGHAS
jgi:cation transporter-like permease